MECDHQGIYQVIHHLEDLDVETYGDFHHHLGVKTCREAEQKLHYRLAGATTPCALKTPDRHE